MLEHSEVRRFGRNQGMKDARLSTKLIQSSEISSLSNVAALRHKNNHRKSIGIMK